MSRARTMLDRGLAVLQRQLGEPFTLDLYPGRTFTGLIEEHDISNTPGVGGLLPEAGSVLYVPAAQFAGIGLRPWPGMRLTVQSREFIVSSVGTNQHRWRLGLTIAHPKDPDVAGPACTVRWGVRPEAVLTDIALPPETELTWKLTGLGARLAYGDQPSLLSWLPEAPGYGYLALPEWAPVPAGIVLEDSGETIAMAGPLEGYAEPAGSLHCLRHQFPDDPDKHRVHRTQGLITSPANFKVLPGQP